MFPPGGLADPAYQAAFLEPRNRPVTDLESWERGGIALNDPSAGLMYQNWYAHVDNQEDGNVYLKPDNGEEFLFLTLPNVELISLTFDQNMAPALAYVQDGIAKFYWFDTVSGEYVTTFIGEGARSPQCSLDDKRPESLSISDIILVYIRDDNLYYVQQRDRYETEHLLVGDISTKMINANVKTVGMNELYCFQILLRANFFG